MYCDGNIGIWVVFCALRARVFLSVRMTASIVFAVRIDLPQRETSKLLRKKLPCIGTDTRQPSFTGASARR